MTPSTSKVGLLWLVGRTVSMQPPWSIATSTMTDPARIVETISAVTSFGAFAPGIRTPPISRSQLRTASAMLPRFDASVWNRPCST
jgi:hypothetical protein